MYSSDKFDDFDDFLIRAVAAVGPPITCKNDCGMASSTAHNHVLLHHAVNHAVDFVFLLLAMDMSSFLERLQ